MSDIYIELALSKMLSTCISVVYYTMFGLFNMRRGRNHMEVRFKYRICLYRLSIFVRISLLIAKHDKMYGKIYQSVSVIELNATFNDISIISWRSFYWWRKQEYPKKTLNQYICVTSYTSQLK
jgi:hypothetical protein